MLKITAVLTDWSIQNDRAHGKVLSDFSSRFEQGAFITTSEIKEATYLGKGDKKLRIIHTQNSTYILL